MEKKVPLAPCQPARKREVRSNNLTALKFDCCIHFNKYVSSYFVTGNILGAGDKMGKNPCPHGSYVVVGDIY